MFLLDAEVEEEAEESKWQDRISSGFDRLVAFASTELDKRRRSTEGNESCNTSPDSGIGHGDPPPATITIPGKQTMKLNPNLKPTLFKMPTNKESSSLDGNDESGPPRTPSPKTSPGGSTNYSPEKSPTRVNPVMAKYQRHPEEKKSKPDHHFKKKFYYREHWRDDAWQKEEEAHDKFKPKGKDYNWHGKESSGQPSDDWNRNQYAWKN